MEQLRIPRAADERSLAKQTSDIEAPAGGSSQSEKELQLRNNLSRPVTTRASQHLLQQQHSLLADLAELCRIIEGISALDFLSSTYFEKLCSTCESFYLRFSSYAAYVGLEPQQVEQPGNDETKRLVVQAHLLIVRQLAKIKDCALTFLPQRSACFIAFSTV